MIALHRDGPTALRLVLLGLAATIAILLVWRGSGETRSAGAPSALATIVPDLTMSLGGDARPAIERSLAQAPDYAPVFDRMRREFSSDFDRLFKDFADRASREGRVETPDFYLSEMIRGLRQRRGVLAARAAPGPLARIFELQAQMLAALAKTDTKLCVDFLYGNVSPGFYDFAARNRRLVASTALAAMDAVSDGRMQKIERQSPSTNDFDLLERDLAKRGLTRVEIDALLDGRAPEQQPDERRMCEAGRIYIEALQGLPESTRTRIHALAVELMARS